MRRVLTFLMLFLTAQQLFDAAKAAYERKDFAGYAAAMTELHAMRPSHPTVTFNYAGALALNGRTDEAIAQLGRLASMQLAMDLSDSDLDSLRTRDDFRAIEQAMAATRTRRISHSKLAFKVPGKELIAEAIAHDPKTDAFFVSAVHKRKILRIANGIAKDFVTANVNGVNGLGVDAKRRILYATSMSYERVENFDKDAKGELFAFDVDSGALKARYEAPADAFLDDLTVAPDGTVYVSDSKGSVLRLHDGRLARFATGMRSAQGSAFGNGVLYVADYGGAIWAVDPRTGDDARLELPDDFTAVGIDGLELAGDSLFAIQNGVTPNRVVRLDLKDMRITRWEIVEMNHPDFDEPTIGAIARGGFYFIANSQGETISKGKASRDAVVLTLPTGARSHTN